MARSAEPGRTALLDAGLALADRGGMRELSVNAVVAQAGMAKGSFYQHFPSRRDFVVALHRRYHDDITAQLLAVVGDMPIGAERLRLGVETFLDVCRTTRGTKAFLAQARTDADLLDEVQARNAAISALVTADLVAVGADHPTATAHLLVAMVADISLQELYDGMVRTDLRTALYTLLGLPDSTT
ncbi:helix-turn-helix domain-containing protein [Gordonia sp. ABSL1-1]|uniref:TetR/AcrR family transcriptional regulator n=1 Tax=Gordonia sp. ABSL1-1 TaxID=3053923 RepID=UPI0025745B22|nr:TetR/AcrR family transcriptional regulator [Gordonia sp. ABSL1-1]MDL9935988.1 helix-turn-helix domain-containing protein [Gordonia sp. ABSL1-1]